MSKVISSKGKTLTPAFRVHPGEILAEEIEERGLKQTELAAQMNVLRHHISDIIHARRNITPRLAVKLEKALGINAEYWMNLQTSYDIAQARELEHA